MKILLAPSEGKATPAAGKPLDLSGLAFATELRERREALLDALDSDLRKAPAAPAAEVYTGVLYQRLGLLELPAAAQRRAERQVLIASALWGFVRPSDWIPTYRLPPTTKLEDIGGLAAWWRQALAAAMPDEPGETAIDMRSGPYSAMWKPKRATLLAVRAFRQRNGERQVVSHMAKAARGEVARALLLSRDGADGPEEVAAAVRAAGIEVELGPKSLDVIERG
jgi:uncharacterized protein